MTVAAITTTKPKSQLKALEGAKGFYRWEGKRSGRVFQLRKDVDRFGRTTWYTVHYFAGGFFRGQAKGWDDAYAQFQSFEREFAGEPYPAGRIYDLIRTAS